MQVWGLGTARCGSIIMWLQPKFCVICKVII